MEKSKHTLYEANEGVIMLKIQGLAGSVQDSFSNSNNEMPRTVTELKENIGEFFNQKSKEVSKLRILGGDPGKNTDPFAGVLIDAYSNGKIDIIGAKQWIDDGRTDFYQHVENEIFNIYKNKKVDIIALERNAPGEPVYEALLHTYQCNVYPVFTIRGKKSDKLEKPIEKINPDSQYNMDKEDMVYWMNSRQEIKGMNNWAKPTTDDMKELLRQWSTFGEYKKGRIEAPPGDHDDLIMGLLIASFVARKRIIEGGNWVSFTSTQLDTGSIKLASLKEELLEEKTGIQWEQKI